MIQVIGNMLFSIRKMQMITRTPSYSLLMALCSAWQLDWQANCYTLGDDPHMIYIYVQAKIFICH